jgi:hypothetical protein
MTDFMFSARRLTDDKDFRFIVREGNQESELAMRKPGMRPGRMIEASTSAQEVFASESSDENRSRAGIIQNSALAETFGFRPSFGIFAPNGEGLKDSPASLD